MSFIPRCIKLHSIFNCKFVCSYYLLKQCFSMFVDRFGMCIFVIIVRMKSPFKWNYCTDFSID